MKNNKMICLLGKKISIAILSAALVFTSVEANGLTVHAEESTSEEPTSEEPTSEESPSEESASEESASEKVQEVIVEESVVEKPQQEAEALVEEAVEAVALADEQQQEEENINIEAVDALDEDDLDYEGDDLDNLADLDEEAVLELDEELLEEANEETVTVIIRFDLNGGTGSVEDIVEEVKKGDTINIPKPSDIYRDGYEFAFWTAQCYTTSGSDQYFRNGLESYTVSENETLDTIEITCYAYWNEIASVSRLDVYYYIRTIDNTIPTPYHSWPNSQYTQVGGKYSSAIEAAKNAYIFDTSGLGSRLLNKPSDADVKSALDNAGWKDKNGQSYDPSLHKVVWYVLKLENNGYHIDGVVQPIGTVNLIYNANIDLLDGISNSMVSNMPKTESGDTGCSFTLSQLIPTITVDGYVYEFLGWTTTPSSSSAPVTDEMLQNVTSDITVYAQWKVTEIPKTEEPDTDTPDENTPGTDTPDENTPGTDTPDENTPGTDTPDENTPGTDTPDENTPDTEIPDESTPTTPTVPSTPSSSTPSSSTPSSSTPSSSTPSTSTSTTTVTINIPSTPTPLAPSVTAATPLTTIAEDATPLAATVEIADESTPLASTVSISDDDVALAATMPTTGDNSRNPYPFAAAGLFAILGAFILGKRNRKTVEVDE